MKLVAVVVAVVLAGCSDAPPAEFEAEPELLHGLVLDGLLAPIPGALVVVQNSSVVTDAGGEFQVAKPAPGTPVIVTADGFVGATKVSPAAGQLNFVLDRVQINPPQPIVRSFNAFISCHVIAAVGHDHSSNGEEGNEIDCSLAVPGNDNLWQLDVAGGLQGALIEATWQPNSDVSTILRLIVDAPNAPAEDVLAVVEGPNVLRVHVSQLAARTYFEENGRLDITVLTGADIENAQSDLVVGAQFQQEVDIFASLFYSEPPSNYQFVEDP